MLVTGGGKAKGSRDPVLRIPRSAAGRFGARLPGGPSRLPGGGSYREIFENAVLGIYRTTPAGRLISVNPAFARLLGYDDCQDALDSLTDIRNQLYMDPKSRDAFLAALHRNGFVSDYEEQLRRKDGTPVWVAVHARVIRDRYGEPCLIEGTLGDIDQRKQAERELTEMNRQLHRQLAFNRVLLDAIPTPVFFKDANGRYLGCNRTFTEFMGVTAEQIRGKTVYELWPSDHARVYHEKDLELLQNPERQVYEFKVKDKNGQVRSVIYSKDVFCDEAGNPAGIVGGFQDISQQKQAEEELADMNRRLEKRVRERTRALSRQTDELARANRRLRELDELKSAFVNSVSHELRTPLTSVLGFAKLVHKEFAACYGLQENEATETARHRERIVSNLTIIEEEGERLTRLINDFLDLSKIEAGRIEWHVTQIDVAALVGRAAESLRGRLEDNPALQMRVEVADDLPRLVADEDRMLQVLLNLLGNAVKFTREGEVAIRAAARDQTLCIQVRDTGEGIPEEEQERIFDKFHQVRRRETRRETPGTGLGLAISRQIVEHFQGSIRVESKVGEGSTFTVELPV